MALHSYKEFAELCGIAPGQIAVYYKRRKIVYTEIDGNVFIDDSIRENKDFLQKKLDAKNITAPKVDQPIVDVPDINAVEIKPTVKVEKPQPIKKTPVSKVSKALPIDKPEKVQASKRQKEREEEENGSRYNLELQKMDADLEKKQIDIRIALLNESKLRGENIPFIEIKTMLSELSHSFINSYKDFVTTSMTDIFHRNKINLEEQAKIKKDLIRGINETHSRVFDKVAQKIKKIGTQTKLDLEDV